MALRAAAALALLAQRAHAGTPATATLDPATLGMRFDGVGGVSGGGGGTRLLLDYAEPQRSPLRTVIVLFLVSTVGLMYWRLALSPLLEPEEGQWLFVLKAALDAAACPECFDGNVLIPTILFLYIWGRLLLRLAGMAAVAAYLGSWGIASAMGGVKETA